MSDEENPNVPDTPWDIQVDQLMRLQNASKEVARDYVIMEWLLLGDTAAYTAFTESGHTPGNEVVRYIGWMMNPARGTEETIPYALKIDGRGRRGRRQDPRNIVRDKLLSQNVLQRMEAGMTYNEALDEVADIIDEEKDAESGDPVSSRDTVEKAYKRYRSKP